MHYGYSACTHENALTAFWKVYRYYLFNITKTLLRRALLFSHDKANKQVCVFTDTFLMPAHQLSSLSFF